MYRLLGHEPFFQCVSLKSFYLSLSLSLSLLFYQISIFLVKFFDLLSVRYIGWGTDKTRSLVKIKLSGVQASGNLETHDNKVKNILSTCENMYSCVVARHRWKKRTLTNYFNLHSPFRLNSDDHWCWSTARIYKLKTLLPNTQLLLRVTELWVFAHVEHWQVKILKWRSQASKILLSTFAADLHVNLGQPF